MYIIKEKGKLRKGKIILIRVNEQEKRETEEMAKSKKKNTSEFYRSLIEEQRHKKFMDFHLKIVERYENMLEKYKKLFYEYKKNNIAIILPFIYQ